MLFSKAHGESRKKLHDVIHPLEVARLEGVWYDAIVVRSRGKTPSYSRSVANDTVALMGIYRVNRGSPPGFTGLNDTESFSRGVSGAVTSN